MRRKFERCILVSGVSGQPQYIKAYHGCYDLLANPLFFREVRPIGTRKYFMFKVILSKPLYVP
jgi:hypothetical protein